MSQRRFNPKTQKDDWYYRIKESFRDQTGRVRSRIMLNVGFIEEDYEPRDIANIGKCLTYLYEHRNEQNLFNNQFENFNEFVRRKSAEFWAEIQKKGSIDTINQTMEESRKKAERLIDVDTIKHTDARNVGAEWVCLQAIRELKLDQFLKKEGWSEVQIDTALAHLITRTVYSPSELKSIDIMRENSVVCELLTGSQD